MPLSIRDRGGYPLPLLLLPPDSLPACDRLAWDGCNSERYSGISRRTLRNMGIPDRRRGRALTHIDRCWLAYTADPSLGEPGSLDYEAFRWGVPGDWQRDSIYAYTGPGNDAGWTAVTAYLHNVLA